MELSSFDLLLIAVVQVPVQVISFFLARYLSRFWKTSCGVPKVYGGKAHKKASRQTRSRGISRTAAAAANRAREAAAAANRREAAAAANRFRDLQERTPYRIRRTSAAAGGRRHGGQQQQCGHGARGRSQVASAGFHSTHRALEQSHYRGQRSWANEERQLPPVARAVRLEQLDGLDIPRGTLSL